MATGTPGCRATAQLGLEHACGLPHPRFPGNNLITTCRQRTNAAEESGLSITSYTPCVCASGRQRRAAQARASGHLLLQSTVSISLRESSWVCGSSGDRWQFLLQALDPRPPRNNRGHLLLRSADLKASHTLLPATAERTSCMPETAPPANGLVWTPHRAERFGKQPSTMCGGMEKPGLKKGFLSCARVKVAPCLLKVGMPEK